MRISAVGLALAVGLTTVFGVTPARAIDVSGSAELTSTQTDSDGVDSDVQQQQYSLRLSQALTPFLRIDLGYGLRDLDSQTAGAAAVTRRSTSPNAQLRYSRPKFSADVFLSRIERDTSVETQNLDSESTTARFNWRPVGGFRLFGDYLRSVSVADVAVFGRDSRVRSQSLGAAYEGQFWSASYRFEQSKLESPGRFDSERDRHEVQLRAARPFFGDRVGVSFFSNLSQLERVDKVTEGAELVSPVPALDGLFAVDTSPEIGELRSNPGLVDGDVLTPAPPGIDIGGAATFRNLGLDLGISTQVTQLEISVTTLSGPEVVWEVYQSPDNLIWERVNGVTSVFDEALLRYTLRFPQTVSRFLKAVNVSPNSEPVVQVSEVRALVDVEPAGSAGAFTADRYRVGLTVSYRPTDRVDIGADVGGSNDEEVSEGLSRRDYSDSYRGLRLTVRLPKTLDLRASYRFEDVEDLREPVLRREIESYTVALGWNPLPTLDAVLSLRRREESEQGTPLQTDESLGLRVLTELLPTLSLTSDLRLSELTDPVSGLGRTTMSWEERIEAQPTSAWTLTGSYRYSRFDADERFPLSSRHNIFLLSQWRVSAYLVLSGGWTWVKDDDTFLQQYYTLSYTPGRLRLTGSYQESGSRGGLTTRLLSATASYRLARYLRLDASLSSSQTTGREVATLESTSLSGRLRVSF